MSDTTFVPQTTVIASSWLNDINIAVYRAIGAGGVAPTTPAQVVANLGVITAAQAQAGSVSYAADTSGAANTVTLAMTPTLSTYTDGMSIRFKVANTNTGATTLNAGPGNLSVTKNGTALSGGELVATHEYTVTVNLTASTAELVAQGAGAVPVATATAASHAVPLSQVESLASCSVTGLTSNFKSALPGLNSYTTLITVDEAVLENSSNIYKTVRGVSLTLNANGTVGAPLGPMQARTASTWMFRWLWYNAANGLTATLDTSATAPTAPTGYASTDYHCRLPGASLTDSSASQYLMQILAEGHTSQYVVTTGTNTAAMPTVANGPQGTFSTTAPTWAGVSMAGIVPTALPARVAFLLNPLSNTNNSAILAPNNNYSGPNGTNPPPLISVDGANTISKATYGSILLESSSVYMAIGTQVRVHALGWEDA